jgi:hypothetical protein
VQKKCSNYGVRKGEGGGSRLVHLVSGRDRQSALTGKKSPEPRPIEVQAPFFIEKKGAITPASLNRRESYRHQKTNASYFLHFYIRKFG